MQGDHTVSSSTNHYPGSRQPSSSEIKDRIAQGAEVEVDPKEVGRIARAAFVGTALEWYDFFLSGPASALRCIQPSLPGVRGANATLAAFATFGFGFLARPLGAVIFGRIGEKYGRRPALSISIVVIGVATGVLGLLPTYGSIGV